MTRVIDIRTTDDVVGTLHEAASALAAGHVLGVPLETEYVAIGPALNERTWHALGLDRVPPHETEASLLLIRSDGEFEDLAGRLPARLGRMLQRCWPGPLAVEFAWPQEVTPLAELPAAVAEGLRRRPVLAAQCSQSEIVDALLCDVEGPILALRTASRCTSGKELQTAAGVALDWLLEAGPVRFDKPATVIRWEGDAWSVRVEGAYSASAVRQMAGTIVVFVCTGNTCRSPMAEALFRKILAERLGVAEDRLEECGAVVTSAGIAAIPCCPASSYACEVLQPEGIDLSRHQSQPLTAELLDWADLVFTMTAGHRDAVLEARPGMQDRVHLLDPEGWDVCDPYGGSIEDYRACRDQIRTHLERIVDRILDRFEAPPADHRSGENR